MRALTSLGLMLLLGACAYATPNAPPDAAASGSGPIPPSFFAMCTVRATDYPKIAIGTVGHPEIGAWAWIERSKGVYDFRLFDNYVNDAIAHGLVDKTTNTVSMAITLGTTPQWAAADPSSCVVKSGLALCTSGPANLQDWTNFITAVMNHYNGVTMPHIRYYELWNETNAKNFWSGTQADMVNLAAAAYPIIHADPHSMLLTPSVVGPVGNVSPLPPFTESATTWMAAYLDAGGARYADGGAFHGYLATTGVAPYPMPEEDFDPGLHRRPIRRLLRIDRHEGDDAAPGVRCAWAGREADVRDGGKLGQWQRNGPGHPGRVAGAGICCRRACARRSTCKWWRGSPGATDRRSPGERSRTRRWRPPRRESLTIRSTTGWWAPRSASRAHRRRMALGPAR